MKNNVVCSLSRANSKCITTTVDWSTRFPFVTTLCKHVRLCYYVSSHGACQQLTSSDSSSLCGNKRIPTLHCSCYLDHFIAMGLGISSSHGKDSDLLCLWAAVSQRQGHLPVGGAVCGVGSGSAEKTPWIITFPQYVFIKVHLLRVWGFHTFFSLFFFMNT